MQMGLIKYKVIKSNNEWLVLSYRTNKLQSSHKTKEESEEAAQSYVAEDYLSY